MTKRRQFAVYGQHSNPLFTGTRTEVLRFLRYLMREEPNLRVTVRSVT